MQRFGTISVLVLFFSVNAMSLWAQSPTEIQRVKPFIKIQTQPAAQLFKIAKLRSPEMMKFLNRQVTVEGFYYDGSIPMIVDDFQRVFMDKMMPPESYVAIVGPRPTGLKWGDKISVTGILSKPGATDPHFVQTESVIIKLTAPQNIKIIKPGLFPKTSNVIVRPPIDIPDEKLGGLIPNKYAILIAGGINPAQNHVRYWNDLKTMYDILLAYGYVRGNIAVIYADGNGNDTSMPVNYSATAANISTVFNILAKKMTEKDTLYIMINNHGGGFQDRTIGTDPSGMAGGVIDTNGDEGDRIQEPIFNLDLNGDGDQQDVVSVDEVIWLWGARMTDDAFTAEVNKIRNCENIIIQMKQCFSGGFIKDLTGPRRIIMSSCSSREPSWSNHNAQFGEFTYWYFAALTGRRPDGIAGTVRADSDNNGRVSILEAYNFARSNDSALETPYFEDDWRYPPVSGTVPNGGDGYRSINFYLGEIPSKSRVRAPASGD